MLMAQEKKNILAQSDKTSFFCNLTLLVIIDKSTLNWFIGTQLMHHVLM